MFRHYLKTSLRRIRQKPGNSLVTILCLAIGTVIFSFFVYVIDIDKFYEERLPGGGRTYRGCSFNEPALREWQENSYRLEADTIVRRYYAFSPEQLPYFNAPGVEAVICEYPDESHDMLFVGTDNVFKGYQKVKTKRVSQNYFAYNRLSLLYGDKVPHNNNEIVVSERLLSRLGITDPFSIEAFNLTLESNDTLNIVNVVKDDKWSRYSGIDVWVQLQTKCIYSTMGMQVRLILEKDADSDSVRQKLEQVSYQEHIQFSLDSNEYNYQEIHHPSFEGLKEQDVKKNLGQAGLRLASTLVLIMAVIVFLRNTILSFAQRRRSNLIRRCAGSRKSGLFAILLTDTLLVLTTALAVSIVIECLTAPLLSSIIFDGNDGDHNIYFNIIDVAQVSLLTYLTVLSVCLVACAVTVHMQVSSLKRDSFSNVRHLPRNILMSIEIGASAFAIATSLFLFSIFWEYTYMPLSWNQIRRTYRLDLNDGITASEKLALLQKIKSLESVESVIACEYGEGGYGAYLDKNKNLLGLFRADSQYFDFFNIPVEYLGNSDSGKKECYVMKSVFDRMLANGTDMNNIELTDFSDYFSPKSVASEMKVAGIFENVVGGFTYDIGFKDLIFVPEISESDMNYFFIRFRRGYSRQERFNAIRNAMDETVYGTTEMNLQIVCKDSIDSMLWKILLYAIAAFTCILLVILGVSSAINADTGSRQREVAIRKIHGAKARDIATMFVRPYLVMLAVPYVIVLAFGVSYIHSQNLSMMSNLILPALTALAILVLVMVLSIYWKVRSIMRTNPADVIKSE